MTFLIDRKHATDFTSDLNNGEPFSFPPAKKCNTSLTWGGQAWNPLLVEGMLDMSTCVRNRQTLVITLINFTFKTLFY